MTETEYKLQWFNDLWKRFSDRYSIAELLKYEGEITITNNKQQTKNDDQSLNKFLLAMIDHQLSGEKEENEKEQHTKQ